MFILMLNETLQHTYNIICVSPACLYSFLAGKIDVFIYF